MPDNVAGNRLAEIARQQQKEKLKGFKVHLLVFVLVMLGLFGINLLNPAVWWVQWPFLGWGIGVLAHGLAVRYTTIPTPQDNKATNAAPPVGQ